MRKGKEKRSRLELVCPPGWRKGQTIFNFLWFLHEKGYHTEMNFGPRGLVEIGGRMADPFNIPNSELEALYEEFLQKHNGS